MGIQQEAQVGLYRSPERQFSHDQLCNSLAKKKKQIEL